MDAFEKLKQIEVMMEWDVEDLIDTLNITPEELLSVEEFLDRALEWIDDNYE